MHVIRILLVDDNLTLQRILQEYLEMHPQIKVVGCAHNGQEALALAGSSKPDLILLDLQSPGISSGLDVIPDLRQVRPLAKIIVVMPMDQAACQPVALAAGANGCVGKQNVGPDLLPTIQRVMGMDDPNDQRRVDLNACISNR